jgi:alcohol dehydrogenase YqhD (iron-dependent ADH family)
MLAHVIERYFTRVPNVELTDRLCEAAMKTMISNAPIVLSEPKNYAARCEIMWSGSVAHNNLLNTGRIGDWASHMIEHELSAINDVAHGAGLAIILPAWMRYVRKHDIERFVQFAARVFNVEQNFHEPEVTALRGIDSLKAFFKSIGMPTSLSEIEITEESFVSIAQKVRKNDEKKGIVGNFVPLVNEDIVEILKLAK